MELLLKHCFTIIINNNKARHFKPSMAFQGGMIQLECT